MPTRRQKTRKWYQRHINDPYVKASQKEGFRTRSAYKLQQIHQKVRLLSGVSRVLDLGAAPGGWSQVLRMIGGTKLSIVAMDLLPMVPLPGVSFFQGDFEDPEVQAEVMALLEGHRPDLIVSDIVPDLSGIRSADQIRAMDVCAQVLHFAVSHLPAQGKLLMKVWMGAGFDELLKQARLCFKEVRMIKPEASRSASSEQYLYAYRLKDKPIDPRLSV